MIKKIQQPKATERRRLKALKEKGTDKLSKKEMEEVLALLIEMV